MLVLATIRYMRHWDPSVTLGSQTVKAYVFLLYFLSKILTNNNRMIIMKKNVFQYLGEKKSSCEHFFSHSPCCLLKLWSGRAMLVRNPSLIFKCGDRNWKNFSSSVDNTGIHKYSIYAPLRSIRDARISNSQSLCVFIVFSV